MTTPATPALPKRDLCGDCHHGTHTDRACTAVEVTGPPSTEAPTPDNPHPGRIVTPCRCQVSTPYRNGHEVG